MHTITIADDEWQRLDDHEPSRLRADLLVNGVPLHVEAWPVYADDQGATRCKNTSDLTRRHSKRWRSRRCTWHICDARHPWAIVRPRCLSALGVGPRRLRSRIA